MPEDEVVITPYRDGPLLVRGPFVLRDQDGTEIRVERETVALCRCGKSRLRPFCDGTHKLTGFRAPSGAEDRAVVPSVAPDGGRFARGDGAGEGGRGAEDDAGTA